MAVLAAVATNSARLNTSAFLELYFKRQILPESWIVQLFCKAFLLIVEHGASEAYA